MIKMMMMVVMMTSLASPVESVGRAPPSGNAGLC